MSVALIFYCIGSLAMTSFVAWRNRRTIKHEPLVLSAAVLGGVFLLWPALAPLEAFLVLRDRRRATQPSSTPKEG
jgi:4-amino-4-deoxy-L-arabinose transferase-like glycosyltransferase